MPQAVRHFLDDLSRLSESLEDSVEDIPILASQAEAEAGTDNEKYMSALRVAQAIAALTQDIGVIHVQDQKAANTDGGNFTSGGDRTRVLNTVVINTISGASLASNQVTLPAGTYTVVGSAPGYQCGFHRTWLFNVTDTATTLLGSSEDQAGSIVQTRSHVQGGFTIAGDKVFELRHRCTTTRNTDGLGRSVNLNGANEVFADLLITKVG